MAGSAIPLIRTSERTRYKRCRWAWDREFNDGLKPIIPAPALRFGGLMHQALEAYYLKGFKRGPHPARTFKKLHDEQVEEFGQLGFRDEEGKWADAGVMGVELLEMYIERYGKDERWYVLATEQPFQVPVLHPGTGKPIATYVGQLDGIWRDEEHDQLFIPDHKSTGTDPTKINWLALDEQAGAYWTYGVEWLKAKKVLKRGQELEGMLYNFLRKTKRDTRPQNADGYYLNSPTKEQLLAEYARRGTPAPASKPGGKPGSAKVVDLLADLGPGALLLGEVSKNQPSPIFHREIVYRDEQDRESVRLRVQEEVREMRLVRQGKLAAYKNPGAMNCPGCGYRDICELEETGADWEAMAESTMTTWDPYEAHAIEADELG